MGPMQNGPPSTFKHGAEGLMGLELFSESYWKLVAHEGRCTNPFSGIATSELLIVQWLALQPCSCWQSWLNIMNDKAESKTKTKGGQDSRR